VGGAAVPIASAAVTAGKFLSIDPWFVIGGASVVLIVVGLLRRASQPALTAQSLAMLGYGGAAVLGLAFSPVVGAALASLALIAHAIWDVVHYHNNAVVPRSLAEFCMFFDIPTRYRRHRAGARWRQSIYAYRDAELYPGVTRCTACAPGTAETTHTAWDTTSRWTMLDA
jgi:hypothetical protein